MLGSPCFQSTTTTLPPQVALSSLVPLASAEGHGPTSIVFNGGKCEGGRNQRDPENGRPRQCVMKTSYDKVMASFHPSFVLIHTDL